MSTLPQGCQCQCICHVHNGRPLRCHNSINGGNSRLVSPGKWEPSAQRWCNGCMAPTACKRP